MALKKGSFTGALPSPSAILLTGMTTVPWRTIILDRQADIKWAGSCPCQEKEASQKLQICLERQRRRDRLVTRRRSPPSFFRTGTFRAQHGPRDGRITDTGHVFPSLGVRGHVLHVFTPTLISTQAQLWGEIKTTQSAPAWGTPEVPILGGVTLMDAGEESVNIIYTRLFHKWGSWYGLAHHFWGWNE